MLKYNIMNMHLYFIFSLRSLFKQIKVVLCDYHGICVSVCLSPPSPINFWMTELIFMKFGMYIMASQPISTAYFINPAHQSLSVCVFPYVARQRLGKNVTAATNTHATMEGLVNAYQRTVGD
jgi:hypothetical protein